MKRVAKPCVARQESESLNPFEWDFSTCPADQLELCLCYERARHSLREKEAAEDWRRNCEGDTFDDYLRPAKERGDYFADHGCHLLYPEFFAKPYLEIPSHERNRRFAMLKLSGACFVSSADSEGELLGIEEAIYEFDREFNLSESGGVSHHGCPYEIEGNAIKCPALGTYAVFRFDWKRSDDTIIDALTLWLKTNRDLSVKMEERRGGGSPVRQFRSQLNELGAWRLLERMSWNDAADLTQERNGKPLYSEQWAWIRAWKNAAKFFQTLTPLK